MQVCTLKTVFIVIFVSLCYFLLEHPSGLILIITKNEEWTFWLLKILLDNIVRSYHTKTMDGLKVDTAVLRELLILRVPDVNKRLEDFGTQFYTEIQKNYCYLIFVWFVGLPCAVISTKWLICIFAEVLPTETVLRIWDCVFNEGYKVTQTVNFI